MILKGKTGKGKNRVRELGPEWILIRTEDSVAFNPERGPWYLIKPASGVKDKERWIHSKYDIDFEITG